MRVNIDQDISPSNKYKKKLDYFENPIMGWQSNELFHSQEKIKIPPLEPMIRPLVSDSVNKIKQNQKILSEKHEQNKEYFKKFQSTKGFTKYVKK